MKELTTKEVAEKLGISLRQVQTLIQRDRLPATKKGRDWFVLESDLKLIRERKKTGRPPKPKAPDNLE
jgi:excisionase family DNA binding protein